MKTISFFALLSLSFFTRSLAVPLAEEPVPSFENQVDVLQLGTSSTRNDLVHNSPCKAVTLIFARGTTEAGNVGSLVGPPFFSALSFAIGSENLAVQGVDYPADIPGFLIGGSPSGSNTMANLINRAFAQCPTTKVVISGYSQGAQLVHNAAGKLSAAIAAKITAIVVFGDPKKGDPIGAVSASNVLTICHDGDKICDGEVLVFPPHLTYGVDAIPAAAFVKDKTGL